MQSVKKLLLVFVSILICVLYQQNTSNDQFSIHFLDVGQADCSIVLCDGHVLMIDGGNSSDSDFVFSYLRNTLKIDHIDYMIATHPHEDHIGGLAGALNACSVGAIYSPVAEYESREFYSLKKYADRQGIQIEIPTAGDSFELGRAKVQFISPERCYEDLNDSSLVVRITYGDTSFLFVGDAQDEAEYDMVDAHFEIGSTLLKVGHHGSDSSSSSAFLNEVVPRYAVISVGRDNKYEHPHEGVLNRLFNVGATVYRTDQQGTIVCTSDGKELSFATEKEEYSGEIQPTRKETEPNVEDEYPYIGNRNSKKLHYANCSSVDDMKEKNKVPFCSKDEAFNDGYQPCGQCQPW